VILVDTSAWTEYLRATGSPAHLRVRTVVEQDDECSGASPAAPAARRRP
jgi:hypothetical protein